MSQTIASFFEIIASCKLKLHHVTLAATCNEWGRNYLFIHCDKFTCMESWKCRYQFDRLPSPRADRRATNFFHQNPHPRDSFSVQNSGPRVKKTKQRSSHPGITCLVRMPRYQFKKEHYSIKAVSFQIFHNCPFDNFLLS